MTCKTLIVRRYWPYVVGALVYKWGKEWRADAMCPELCYSFYIPGPQGKYARKASGDADTPDTALNSLCELLKEDIYMVIR